MSLTAKAAVDLDQRRATVFTPYQLPLPVIYNTAEVVPRLLRVSTQIRGQYMTRLTWQEYFEQFIRAQLQDLAASQASGRELIERLRAIAADYKLFLFDDNSRARF
jgi:hypothetical protein